MSSATARSIQRSFGKSGSNPVAILIFLALALSACATSSKTIPEYSTFSGVADPDASTVEQESKLRKLSHDELILRGNQYLAADNANLARVHFRAALEKKNDSAPAYAGLGEALFLEGENRLAGQMLARALAIDAGNRRALITAGRVQMTEKNYAQAATYFQQAGDVYPDDPEILTELAIASSHLGREEQAETALVRVVTLKPRDHSALNNLGFHYLLTGRYDEAIETLDKALSLKPDDPRTRNNLAAAYALNNKSQKAFDLLRHTIGEAGAYNDMGYFFMLRGLEDPARDSFEKALEISPRHYVRAKENLRILEKTE